METDCVGQPNGSPLQAPHMHCDNGQHSRRSIRMPGYDYSREGAYFVTICAYQRRCLFGRIVGDEMRLNRWGEIITKEWLRTEEVRSTVMLDVFVVMPNHFHGIIMLAELVGATRWVAQPEHHGPDVGATQRVAQRDYFAAVEQRATRWVAQRDYFAAVEQRATQRVAPTGPARGSVGAIVGQVKSVVSRRVNVLRNAPGALLWQRHYYEHIIRDADEYEAIRWYIKNNPARWAEDRENPEVRKRVLGGGSRIRPDGMSRPEWLRG